jgi:hypothetical protein
MVREKKFKKTTPDYGLQKNVKKITGKKRESAF